MTVTIRYPLNSTERTLMEHALGLSTHDKPYRNRFYAYGDGSTSSSVFSRLCARGLAVYRDYMLTHPGGYFAVTDLGMCALGVTDVSMLEEIERHGRRLRFETENVQPVAEAVGYVR